MELLIIQVIQEINNNIPTDFSSGESLTENKNIPNTHESPVIGWFDNPSADKNDSIEFAAL